MNDYMWGPEYQRAMQEVGFISPDVIVHKVTIVHDQQEFSKVNVEMSLRPTQLKVLADHVVENLS